MTSSTRTYLQIPVEIKVEGQAPPHEDLANMRDGPQPKEQFLRTWGKLFRWELPPEVLGELASNIRDLLRRAWRGDSKAVERIRSLVHQSLSANLVYFDKKFQVTFERFDHAVLGLFLLDYDAGRTAICANPECAAPYFIKKRSSNKYCGTPACAAEAHRKYLRDSWARHGKEWRKPRKRREK